MTQLTLDGGEVSVTERLDEIADRLERDRREPDKVLGEIRYARDHAKHVEWMFPDAIPADLEETFDDLAKRVIGGAR